MPSNTDLTTSMPSTIARGGTSSRGRGKHNSRLARGGRGGSVSRKPKGCTDNGNSNNEQGVHPAALRIIVDPNSTQKMKELSQTTIRRDAENKIIASKSRDHERINRSESSRAQETHSQPVDAHYNPSRHEGNRDKTDLIRKTVKHYPRDANNVESDIEADVDRHPVQEGASSKKPKKKSLKRPPHVDTSPDKDERKKRRVHGNLDDAGISPRHIGGNVRGVVTNSTVRNGSQSARSGPTQKKKNPVITEERRGSALSDSVAVGELKSMIYQLQEENKEMKDIMLSVLGKLSDTPIGVQSCVAANVKKESVEVNSTPKKKFEEGMLSRLDGITHVFSDDQFRISCMKVIPKFIINSVDKNSEEGLRLNQVPELFQTLLFAVPRDSKGPSMMSKIGKKASYMRRSIILDCLRRGQSCFDSPPFWLRSNSDTPDDRQDSYINDKFVLDGFDRRERSGYKQDDSSRRRNSIANGTVKPTSADDAEYIGWWSYGRLTSFLNQARRNAIAMLFESVAYLFVPWWYSVADKRGYDTINADSSARSTSAISDDVSTITSKKTLKIEWISDQNFSKKGIWALPASKLQQGGVYDEAYNLELFRKVVEQEIQLQMKVEHAVLVRKSSEGKSSVRQRKGVDLKTYTRKMSMMDAAAQFMNGITGGDRSTCNSFCMKFNKKSLIATAILATALRDIIDRCSMCNEIVCNRSIVHEVDDECTKNELQALFKSFIPNEQVQSRTFSRTLFAVVREVYEENNIEKTKPKTFIEPHSSGDEDRTTSFLRNNYLLDDEDEDVELCQQTTPEIGREIDENDTTDLQNPSYGKKDDGYCPPASRAGILMDEKLRRSTLGEGDEGDDDDEKEVDESVEEDEESEESSGSCGEN